jgi:hypothetical protein
VPPTTDQPPGAGSASATADVEVSEATSVDDALFGDLRRLLPQLSSSASPLQLAELHQIVASPATVLFVARRGGTVVGTLTLALFRVPTGVRAWMKPPVAPASVPPSPWQRWREPGRPVPERST